MNLTHLKLRWQVSGFGSELQSLFQLQHLDLSGTQFSGDLEFLHKNMVPLIFLDLSDT